MITPVPSAVRFISRSCGPDLGAPPRGLPKKNSNGSTPSTRAANRSVVVMLTTSGFTLSASAGTSNVAGTGAGGRARVVTGGDAVGGIGAATEVAGGAAGSG